MIKAKSTAAELLLAVDAGGTKTAAWLVDTNKDETDCILGRGRSSAGNPLSVGFAECTRAIAEAITRARAEAQPRTNRVARLILSIAGSANHGLRDRIIDWAHTTGVAEQVAVVTDVLPVLAAGTPNCCGVALVAGTGSVCFGRAADGRTTLCGGWGYLLGDEGSGYAIGRAGLQYALGSLESKGTRHPLAAAVLAAVEANTVMELTKHIYGSEDSRSTIGSVAPLVIKAADGGDADAQAILDSAAGDLAKLVARTYQSLGAIDNSLPLAVAGGVLVGSNRLQQQLHIELRRIGLAGELTVVDEPLNGCVRLADAEFADTLVTWQ